LIFLFELWSDLDAPQFRIALGSLQHVGPYSAMRFFPHLLVAQSFDCDSFLANTPFQAAKSPSILRSHQNTTTSSGDGSGFPSNFFFADPPSGIVSVALLFSPPLPAKLEKILP